MNNFLQEGYAIILQVLNTEQIAQLKAEIKQSIDDEFAHGIRHIDKKIPAVYRLAYSSSIINCLRACSDRQMKLVRAIYFN